MKTAMWFVAPVTLGLVCAGCTMMRSGSPWADECRRTPETTPKAPAKPAPAHPDFARLLSHRNYYKIEHVGAYEHHFAVWFHCIEPSVSYYAVSKEGAVRTAGGFFGGLALRGGEPRPVPDDMREQAKLVRDRHGAAYQHASTGRIEYLGSYREVVINEVVPDSEPGDPYERMMGHATVTLRADADLTSVSGIASMEGGDTRMCWRDLVVVDCGEPRWIDFAPKTGTGVIQIPALARTASPQPAEERARFLAAALSAARGLVGGEPGARLDTILERQGSSILPPDFAPPITVSFTIYARVADAAVMKQEDAKLSVSVPTLEVLRGGARGTATTRLVGVDIKAEVEIAPVDPSAKAAPDARGKSRPKLRLRYRLSDGRGNAREAEIPLSGEALIEGESVQLKLDALPQEMTSHIHDPPMGQHFPAAGQYIGLDTYLNISSVYERWWQ